MVLIIVSQIPLSWWYFDFWPQGSSSLKEFKLSGEHHAATWLIAPLSNIKACLWALARLAGVSLFLLIPPPPTQAFLPFIWTNMDILAVAAKMAVSVKIKLQDSA